MPRMRLGSPCAIHQFVQGLIRRDRPLIQRAAWRSGEFYGNGQQIVIIALCVGISGQPEFSLPQKLVEDAHHAAVGRLGVLDTTHAPDLLGDEIGCDPVLLQDQRQLSRETPCQRGSRCQGHQHRQQGEL